MNRLWSYHKRLMATTCLLSISLIAYQVAIIQLLSYVQWHHYASMVISIALLGFGAAGTFVSLFRKWLLNRYEVLLPVLAIVSGLTMVIALWLSRSGFARFDSYLLFVDTKQWLALFINYLLFFLPFFFGALALGIIFVKYVGKIGKFYFSNLIGSAIGAILAAALAWFFSPAVLPVVMAIIAIASGLIMLPKKKRMYIIVLAIAGLVFTFYRILQPVDLTISEYKSLSRTLNLPASQITIEKSGPYGFVQVVSANALRYAPGLSLAFTGEVPVRKALFNNGDWYGPVVSWNKADSFHLLDYTTMALPYVLTKPGKVLVLHAGTGIHTSHALSRGATDIDAVEPHKTVNDILLNELSQETDSLLYRPTVKLHEIEPRSFLSATHKKYDLIQLPVIGAFGGGVGLHAMREEYTFTKESFLRMLNMLEKGGAICVTAWMDYPFRNSLKVAATLAETAEAAGLSPLQSHIIAVRSWGTITFLLKKSPVSSSDTMRIRQFCDRLYFDPVFLPGALQEERTIYNALNDTAFFLYMDELMSGRREKLYRQYDFYLRPASDDKPYFSQFLRWKSLADLAGIFGAQSVPFIELGWLISVITLIQLSLFALVLIILPLLKMGWKGSNRFGTFVYFSGLGIGYMLFEIILIQQFIIFLGNPVYAAALVIAVMLLASGSGSYLSSGIQLNRRSIKKILLIIAGLMVIYSLFLSTMLQNVAGINMIWKVAISLIIIGVPAVLMGMPFPMCLGWLSRIEENNIPWAWAINGCMSVISAALATLLTVELGFTIVIIFVALAYLLSLMAISFSLSEPRNKLSEK
jgi:hypothetical protein